MALRILVPLFCLILMTVVGLIIPIRPTVSSVEKRNLTTFPEFSVEDFLDGTYTSDISVWFADTFPMRDQLISGNEMVTSPYGLNEQQIYGDMKKGDEIPDLDSVESVDVSNVTANGASQPDSEANGETQTGSEPQTADPETERRQTAAHRQRRRIRARQSQRRSRRQNSRRKRSPERRNDPRGRRNLWNRICGGQPGIQRLLLQSDSGGYIRAGDQHMLGNPRSKWNHSL